MCLTKGRGYWISNICRALQVFSTHGLSRGILLLGHTPMRDMNEANRSIFRKEAVEKYIQEQENQVLPKFISPRLFLCLWIVFGLFFGLAVWLCFAEVPMFVSGRGMIVDQDKRNACQGQKPCIVAFFTPDIQPRLIAGKSLMIKHKNQRQWLDQPVIIVESKVLSPAQIQKNYGPTAGGMPLAGQPSAVAVCRLDPDSHPMRSDSVIEGAFEVRIDAGTRRLGSFLPVLDHFFGKFDRPGRKGI